MEIICLKGKNGHANFMFAPGHRIILEENRFFLKVVPEALLILSQSVTRSHAGKRGEKRKIQ